MKVIILTASTGNGHNQAANNLKYEIESRGHEAIVLDIFKDCDQKVTNIFFEKGYDFIIKYAPKLYGVLYSAVNTNIMSNILGNLLFMARKKLKEKIEEENPDVIISMHPYAVPIYFYSTKELLKRTFKDFKDIYSKIRASEKILNEEELEDSQISIPYIQIVTDFKAHNVYFNKNISAYIVGSDFTKDELIKGGIDKNKVFTYGIPIKEEFRKTSRNENIDFNILIMGGGMGLDSMKKATDELITSNIEAKITVICGKNESLKNYFVEKYNKDIKSGRVIIYGFTTEISKIMNNSSVIITKPGGLTSTEAISKALPMIIPFYIEGQEKENVNFLTEHGMALEVAFIDELVDVVKLLMDNKELYNNMVSNMKNLSINYSNDKIIELAIEFASK